MPVQTVGVAGLRLPGRGIAACLLANGLRVIGYTKKDSREDARHYIAAAIDDLVRRGGAKRISNGRGFYRYTPEEADRWERILIENV